MGLTQKILLFVSLLVMALVGTTLAFTTFQADRLAHAKINQALSETRGVWDAFQADRYNKLKLGVRVLGNDPAFKAAITSDQATVYDMLQERGKDLGADFFVATDPAGIVIARSDRPGAQGQDLSKDPVVMKPLEGEESATVWRQGDKLFHAVSVPMQFGADIVGVLIAGYGINETLASDIRKITHSEIAYLTQQKGQAPQLSVSSLGPKEAALRSALAGPEFTGGSGEPFEVDLGGERHVGVSVPLKAASGEVVGSVVALRSLRDEMASFTRFRNSLIAVSLVVMAVALGIAYFAASRITGTGADPREPRGAGAGRLVLGGRDGGYGGRDRRPGPRLQQPPRRPAREGADDRLPPRGHHDDAEERRPDGEQPSDPRHRQWADGRHRGGLDTDGGQDREGEPVRGTLRGHGAARQGRHGRRLPGPRSPARRDRGREGPAPEVVKEDPSLLDRFKHETKLARKITHRNVLRTHDFGETDGTPYISMEYLDGVTLKDLIQNKGALPAGVGLRIAKQMCQGLDAAHRQGVIHRDIKPQNMLILPETGELKIMDFGIARGVEVKAGSGGLTTDGTVMGTPDYMAPEQAQGHPVDFRTDIYSLGVVLFEVFTGTLPFKMDNPMATVLAHIQNPPPKPRSRNPRDLGRPRGSRSCAAWRRSRPGVTAGSLTFSRT